MTEILKEWIDKAEGDYHSAIREYRLENFPIMMLSDFMHNNVLKSI